MRTIHIHVVVYIRVPPKQNRSQSIKCPANYMYV